MADPNYNPRPPPRNFDPFKKLPFDIRMRVWFYARSDRVVTVTEVYGPQPAPFPPGFQYVTIRAAASPIISPTLQVNQEARYEGFIRTKRVLPAVFNRLYMDLERDYLLFEDIHALRAFTLLHRLNPGDDVTVARRRMVERHQGIRRIAIEGQEMIRAISLLPTFPDLDVVYFEEPRGWTVENEDTEREILQKRPLTRRRRFGYNGTGNTLFEKEVFVNATIRQSYQSLDIADNRVPRIVFLNQADWRYKFQDNDGQFTQFKDLPEQIRRRIFNFADRGRVVTMTADRGNSSNDPGPSRDGIIASPQRYYWPLLLNKDSRHHAVINRPTALEIQCLDQYVKFDFNVDTLVMADTRTWIRFNTPEYLDNEQEVNVLVDRNRGIRYLAIGTQLWRGIRPHLHIVQVCDLIATVYDLEILYLEEPQFRSAEQINADALLLGGTPQVDGQDEISRDAIMTFIRGCIRDSAEKIQKDICKRKKYRLPRLFFLNQEQWKEMFEDEVQGPYHRGHVPTPSERNSSYEWQREDYDDSAIESSGSSSGGDPGDDQDNNGDGNQNNEENGGDDNHHAGSGATSPNSPGSPDQDPIDEATGG